MQVPQITKITSPKGNTNQVIICSPDINFNYFNFSAMELEYIEQSIADNEKTIKIGRIDKQIWIFADDENKAQNDKKEAFRKHAFSVYTEINKKNISGFTLIDRTKEKALVLAFLEGLLLSAYRFNKYFTNDKSRKENYLSEINLVSESINEEEIKEVCDLSEGVYLARTWINEPLSYLTAEKFSSEISKACSEAGIQVEVFDKAKIKSLKLGGLLSVNKGSTNPPTFTVLEWKPENAKNTKPIVLVGKGVVYDTGGLSIKPTPNSMDYMKSDMGGAAAVAGAIYSAAKQKLPYYVVALIPASENSISSDAYVPGDVIKMHNGLSVEVMNTDAEGRLLLADALSYAQRYQPELVIDAATLTGAAAVAVGKEASVVMGTAGDKVFEKLEQSSQNTYERIVRFPFWEEYGEYIKSTIADIKNLGGKEAGAITAGKFLEYFTDYPWIHVDIAGPSYMFSTENYKGIGGTGVGVRLFYDFIKNYSV